MSAIAAGAPSRNAPCPCGSGRRYKECHGAPGGGAPGSPDSIKRAAIAAQQAGQLDEAARLYLRALEADPGDFDALHMLGVTRLMQGRFGEAVDWISRALAVRPGVAAALRNLEIARHPRGAHPIEGYDAWRETRERARDERRAGMRGAIASRPGAPGISVVVPVYDTPAPLLRTCLDSVLAQGYPHWELCIADDASPSPHVVPILREYAARDARVKVAFRARNGHISAASNSALALATKPWIALLDHDDVLASCALAEVALAIDARADAAILYSDEDKIDESGRRYGAYFKPAWNPALLRSQNFVSHLGAYRRDLVLEVGGFRPGYEGAQDWDLVLRCSERVEPRAIRHIPQVLYHWRAIAGSTARGHSQKSYAAAAQERAIVEHWARRGIDVATTRVADGHHLRADPKLEPSISLIVLASRGSADEDPAWAWHAASATLAADVEVVAIGTGEAVPGEVDAGPLRFARGDAARINDAAGRGRGEVLVFVRADIAEPSPDSVRTLAAHAALPEAGPVGGLLIDAFGMRVGGAWLLDPESIADAAFLGTRAPTNSLSVREAVVQNMSAVRGDAMAIRRALWNELGGYDTAAFDRSCHDVDLALRAERAGCRAIWHPSAVFRLARSLGVDAVSRPDLADAEAMRARHGARLAHDPAYHPELDRAPRRFECRRDDGPADADAR